MSRQKNIVVSHAGPTVEIRAAQRTPHLSRVAGDGVSASGARGGVSIRETVMVGVFLALLQALDAVLTSMGIARYGVSIEGNPLLRSLMEQFGHIPTLAILKTLAIIVIASLTVVALRLPWVKNAMNAVSVAYVILAIIPWAYILFFKTSIEL